MNTERIIKNNARAVEHNIKAKLKIIGIKHKGGDSGG